MQPRERADQVFSHRVVTENGFEKIVPVELDPYKKGRAITLLEAEVIIGALIGQNIEQKVSVQMFEPMHEAGPIAEVIDEQVTSPDPSRDASLAAMSAEELNKQFSLAA